MFHHFESFILRKNLAYYGKKVGLVLKHPHTGALCGLADKADRVKTFIG